MALARKDRKVVAVVPQDKVRGSRQRRLRTQAKDAIDTAAGEEPGSGHRGIDEEGGREWALKTVHL